MMLSDVCLSVCLSVAYIGPKSRTERPRKTKIGIEVAHVRCDSDATFKFKRSKVKVNRPLYSPGIFASDSCSGDRGNVFTVGTYCYVVVRRGRLGGAKRFGTHRGRRGAVAYCGSRTACLKQY